MLHPVMHIDFYQPVQLPWYGYLQKHQPVVGRILPEDQGRND